MKCICGYEIEDNNEDDDCEKFIKIDGHFSITEDPGGWNENVQIVKLYACPKCNTVQLKVW